MAIDGAIAPATTAAGAGGESDLDFELALPLIFPQTTTLFQTDDINYAEGIVASEGFLNTFLDALDGSYCSTISPLDPVYPDTHRNGFKGALQCGVYTPTKVISISYGFSEAELPASYQSRQCNEFLKLGLQGTTVFVASGDSGVAGRVNQDECLGPNAKVFSPGFPATCPWLTSVGATKIEPGMTVNEPESSVTDPIGHPFSVAFSSGGGFSNVYGIPSYQASTVASYFANHNPPYTSYSGNDTTNFGTGLYNRIGRYAFLPYSLLRE